MMKVPYGISNFAMLSRENYYFVDKTPFIALLEQQHTKYHTFLRPRRFGKSLWISVLEYYYGYEHRKDFDALFGRFYIGKNPTPNANAYLVLSFEFSRIDTATPESTYQGFLTNTKSAALYFVERYADILDLDNATVSILQNLETPEAVIKKIFDISRHTDHKIYIVIDEYDHFANELLAFHAEKFQKMVSRNGWVRKFYESIKTATQTGVVANFFITGVSPITLDSMTSGFNMTTNLTLDVQFHNMMGFDKHEVKDIVKALEVPDNQQDTTLNLWKRYYNGYLFDWRAGEESRLYNSDMVLYFAREYSKYKTAPQKMLDVNIMTDYRKIRNTFNMGRPEIENLPILETLIHDREIEIELTEIFNMERGFSESNFVSLLFYMGLLTIKKMNITTVILQMPNKVIEDLYYDYFLQILQERAETHIQLNQIAIALNELAKSEKIGLIMNIIERTLQGLSVRDQMRYYEATVKSVFFTHLQMSSAFIVKSEYESAQSFIDIAMFRSPLFPEVAHEFLFELKYLKKEDEKKLLGVKRKAKKQLLDYCALPEFADNPRLRAYIIIVIGADIAVCQKVK